MEAVTRFASQTDDVETVPRPSTPSPAELARSAPQRYGFRMTLLSIALGFLAMFLLVRVLGKRNKGKPVDSSVSELACLEPWLTEAVQRELTRNLPQVDAVALGKSLRGNPDPEVVAAVETKVAKVDLEFVHYAHESDADVTLRVHYEGDTTGTERKRTAVADLPESVRRELSRGVTRVYRTWDFSWMRVS